MQATNLPDNNPPAPLIRWLHRLEDTLLVAALCGMMGMAVLQILLRILFHSGVVWADGFVRLLVLWVGLLGAVSASRDDSHIRIDLLTRFFTTRLKLLTGGVTQLATAGICALTSWFSFRFLLMEHEFGSPAFAQVPAWVCETIIPFGFLVIALRYAALSFHQFKTLGKRS